MSAATTENRIGLAMTGGEPLVGSQSQQVDLGLLGARTAAVLRRIGAGQGIDPYDETVIHSAEAMLERTAEAIEFVSSGGRIGSRPQAYSFGSVALTLEATSPGAHDDDAVKYLRDLAGTLHGLLTTQDSAVATSILPVFSAIAEIATRTAGSPGDSARLL
jgi:hypothetical protein